MKINKIVIILILIFVMLFSACNKKDETNNITNTNNNLNSNNIEQSEMQNTDNEINTELNKSEDNNKNTTQIEEEKKEVEDSKSKKETVDSDESDINQRPEISEEGTVTSESESLESNNQTTQNDGNVTEKQIEVSTFFRLPKENERPVAVMIDNEGSGPYPQGGLEKAQIIYETVGEYGVTRLMGVFFGIDEGNVGPVRSIRHYNIDFAIEHDSVLTHIGQSPLGRKTLEANDFADINGVYSKYFWLFFDITSDPDNWQDTYTKFESINRQISASGFRNEAAVEPVFEYADNNLEGIEANNVYIPYSSHYYVTYEYDVKKQVYLRYRMKNLHKERYTNKVLAAKNIIIQKVNTYPIEGDSQGRMDMDNVGEGSGYIITNGKAKEINWEKTSRFSQTRYSYNDSGEEVLLNQGQTWVMIVPDDIDITIN